MSDDKARTDAAKTSQPAKPAGAVKDDGLNAISGGKRSDQDLGSVSGGKASDDDLGGVAGGRRAAQ